MAFQSTSCFCLKIEDQVVNLGQQKNSCFNFACFPKRLTVPNAQCFVTLGLSSPLPLRSEHIQSSQTRLKSNERISPNSSSLVFILLYKMINFSLVVFLVVAGFNKQG